MHEVWNVGTLHALDGCGFAYLTEKRGGATRIRVDEFAQNLKKIFKKGSVKTSVYTEIYTKSRWK